MSATNDEVCASCGVIAGDDGIKLKKCTACKLVHYCSVECQKEHRPQHKRECKRRAAELRDELLFKQSEISHLGECPICCLPLPLSRSKTTQFVCCSKVVCAGCSYASRRTEMEASLQQKCPFCRAHVPKTIAEANQQLMKRIDANSPVAMRQMAGGSSMEIEPNYKFELLSNAAGLGDIESHCQLAYLYELGEGVERDGKKAMYHLEEAAIGGHPAARCNLGDREGIIGRIERAVKHHAIAAKLGYDDSMEQLKEYYKMGFVKKEDLAVALRAHKAAVDATKSPQREAAEQYL